jgi:hypothetical protein
LHIIRPIYLISLRGTMALSAGMRSLGWCDRRARCGVLGTYGVFDVRNTVHLFSDHCCSAAGHVTSSNGLTRDTRSTEVYPRSDTTSVLYSSTRRSKNLGRTQEPKRLLLFSGASDLLTVPNAKSDSITLTVPPTLPIYHPSQWLAGSTRKSANGCCSRTRNGQRRNDRRRHSFAASTSSSAPVSDQADQSRSGLELALTAMCHVDISLSAIVKYLDQNNISNAYGVYMLQRSLPRATGPSFTPKVAPQVITADPAFVCSQRHAGRSE